MSDQGPIYPATAKPANSTSIAPIDQARLNLEQMILDALDTADDEMAKAIMAKGKLSFYIEHGTKSSDSGNEASTEDSVAAPAHRKLVSQEFSTNVYFGDKSAESTSLRETQRRDTLSKFRPVHDPSEFNVSADSAGQRSLGKVKIASNEYLDSLGRKAKQEADSSSVDIDEHDEDWALRDRR